MRIKGTGLLAIWYQLQQLVPKMMTVNAAERVRICCGALFAILVTGLVTRTVLGTDAGIPMLIAPMGASAVLLFAVPTSPLAQPWPILLGNTISATIGVACGQWIPEPIWAAAIALAASIAAMFALRCLHPPSGAIALTAVLGGAAIKGLGFQFVLMPVAINSVLLVLLAFFFNNASGRRYPQATSAEFDHAPAREYAAEAVLPLQQLGFSEEDLDKALEEYNQVLDVSREDLESLFVQTARHAHRRRFGEICCANLMSRDVVAVEFGTPLEEAFNLLNKHNSKALPVIDPARRVIGMVTPMDFMKHVNLQPDGSGLLEKLRQLVRRSGMNPTAKPEVVGQIMTSPVQTVSQDLPIMELVPLLLDEGRHQIPIVDAEGRLAGMLTQADLISALYQGGAPERPPIT